MGCNTSQHLHIATGEYHDNRNSNEVFYKNDDGDTTTTTGSISTVHHTLHSVDGDGESPRSPYFDFQQRSNPASSFSRRRRAERGEHAETESRLVSGIIQNNMGNIVVDRDAGQTLNSDTSMAGCEFNDSVSLAELTELLPLANGGFCVVCSCVYRGQRAVVKVPRPNGPVGAMEDLTFEIELYKRISAVGGHTNMARAFGAGFHFQQGQWVPFLVLELVQGGTLAQVLDRNRPSQGNTCSSDPYPRLPLALEIAEALAFLHNEAVPGGFVLHRDLKPANIGLCEKGHVKVFDLGLSVVRENRGALTDKYEMSGMAGSKRFMAPEVCNAVPYNEKVDVYSFSIVVWELCELRKPFAGMSAADHFRKVVQGGQRPRLDPAWPAELRDLLEACWDEDPDARPSIVEARERLRAMILRGC